MTAPNVVSEREKVLANAKALLADGSVRANSGATAPYPEHGTDGTNDDPPRKNLALIRADSIKIRRFEFLWKGRIPRGKLTGDEGRMGTGKTTTMIDVVAAATTGRGLPGQSATPMGDAILISLEDDPADTLVPRLRAAGADLSRCHIFNGYEILGELTPGVFNLGADCERLRRAIEETQSILVVIDPLTATLASDVNSFRDQDVRRVLAPLAQVAQDTGCAIVFVRHFRKGGGAAEDAGGGSVGIGAACRSVLRVDRDPEDPSRYLLSSVKSSLTAKPPTVGYRIELATVRGDDGEEIETSRVAWDGFSDWTADRLAAQAMEGDDRSRSDEAKEWLEEALANGAQRPAKELFRAADAEGIPRRTLQRAADALRVVKARRGFGEGSTWCLPASIRANEPSFAPFSDTARMGANGTNELDVAV